MQGGGLAARAAHRRTFAIRAAGIALTLAVSGSQAAYFRATADSIPETANIMIALVFAAGVSIYDAVTAEEGSERRFWTLLTLIGALLLSGRVYLAIVPLHLHRLPNPASFFDLGAAIVFIVALAVATRLGEAGPAARLRYVADLLACLVVTYALMFSFVLAPLAASAHLTLAARMTMAGYPAAGALLLLGTLTQIARPSRLVEPWERFLSAGLILFGGTSITWPWWDVSLTAAEKWWATPWIEVMWVLALGIVGCAALFRATSRQAAWRAPDVVMRPGPDDNRESVTWTLLAMAVIALVVLTQLTSGEAAAALLLAAFALALLAALRAAVSAFESQYRAKWSDNDPLTGLPHAAAFRMQLETESRLAERRNEKLYVVVADVGGISLINRLHGSAEGDRVLRIIGKALSRVDALLLSRLGGGLFAFVASELDRAEDICRRLEAEIVSSLPGRSLTLASGISVFPDHGRDADELIGAAWRACVSAKSDGSDGMVVFDPLDGEPTPQDNSDAAARRAAFDALRLVAEALDATRPSSAGHSGRVAAMAVTLGRRLGISGPRLRRLHAGALVHDIGKITLDDHRIDVASGIDARALQAHARESAALLEDAGLLEIASWVRLHHDDWSGAARSLPLEARVLAVCDAYDRFVERRGEPSAGEALMRLCGGPLDPQVAAELLVLLAERRAS